MAGSGKSSSIVGSFSKLLLEAWEKWDVRGMVLFSLSLQIVLSVLGSRRKYTIKPFFKTILWFAYLGADWIAIATLGKLSGSYTESPTTNVLRTYWAPLLLLHLGGPDTITAYAFEDNKFWIRHLLILLVKAVFVFYVVCLSWTFSWLSFLSFPLILAGIIKYVEKILCLKLNNSQKTKSVISKIFKSQSHPHLNENQTLDHILEENSTVLLGYLFFTIMRPDVNDYLSSHSLSYNKIRIMTCVKETTGRDDLESVLRKLNYVFEISQSNLFDILAIKLEFIFDVVYTKVALIYTKLGGLLRLTSIASFFPVLMLFFISIINEPKFHFSRVDLVITGILLTGAIALEVYAAWMMLSSDWAILVAEFHHNMLVRKMFKATLKCCPCLSRQSKRCSNHIGQFDLLQYCWTYKKKENQSWRVLQNITNCSDFIEMWHKYKFTNFVPVPSYLMDIENFFSPVTSIVMSDSFWPSRGKNALTAKGGQYSYLIWSIELDFDYSIIIWHLATSVCCYQEPHDDVGDKAISKQVSNYMMYLLAMCPALILSDHSKSFWLDHTYDMLKKLLFSATDITNVASDEDLESSGSTIEDPNVEHESRVTTLEDILRKDVSKLVRHLKQLENKWELIRDVWIEMLVYAAVSSQHISHVKQLGEGIEFLSLIWLFVGLNVIIRSIEQR